MKAHCIIAVIAFMVATSSLPCNAQTEQKHHTVQKESSHSLVYERNQVEKQAAFAGGEEKLMEFMIKNLKYPEEAKKDKASGVVQVQFVVETDGSLAEIKVCKSAHSALDAECIRFVKAMPKWTPAKIKGKAVRQRAIVSIPFRLN
ncbi:MAG: energy transducer TonB [Bacteroides sp.]|nr:energy transducer TonB [Bacteroides sp.]MCM1448577.1 energy transducer TonB [Bacteroides sp.]MCM1515449.1 energy transducer TonB [Paraprevotella sp.]